ncbi:MAG: serpin family protein [Salinivirgaceae bacterium]
MVHKILPSILFALLSHNLNAQPEEMKNTGNAPFAIDLYKQSVKLQPGKSFCLSPFSISQSLAMAYTGARNQTQQEMERVLYFEANYQLNNHQLNALNQLLIKNTDSVDFISANTLWGQKRFTFLPDFLEQLETHYQAPIEKVDFKKKRQRNIAAKTINNWVADQTKNQINDLISADALTPDTRLILVNALYFYGLWHDAFNPEHTLNDSFKNAEKETTLPFMRRLQMTEYYSDDLIQAVALPYKGEKQKLIILLPTKADGLERLENTLDNNYLNSILTDARKIRVALSIPRFEVETALELSELLRQMGLHQAFSNQADFSGITGTKELRIDKVFHGAKIKVNETGTKAAAGTATVMVRKSAQIMEISFHANHPFIYYVIDSESRTILFMGRFMGS